MKRLRRLLARTVIFALWISWWLQLSVDHGQRLEPVYMHLAGISIITAFCTYVTCVALEGDEAV